LFESIYPDIKTLLEIRKFQVPIQIASWLQSIDDSIRAMHLPHVKYILDRVENGNMKLVVEISTDLNKLNASVITPVSGYKYVQVPLQGQLFEGMIMDKPVPQPGWHAILDNTHFTVNSLRKMMEGSFSKSSPNIKDFLRLIGSPTVVHLRHPARPSSPKNIPCKAY